jgi:hypothetical protein
VNFTPPSGCTHVEIYLYCPSTNGGICYFDDVSLREQQTSGNVWLGEQTDGMIVPVNGSVGDTLPADFCATIHLTYETGKYFLLNVRAQTPGSEYVRFDIQTDGSLKIQKNTGGGLTEIDSEAGIFTDGEYYRVRCYGHGSRLWVYVDDKLILDVTDSAYSTVAYFHIQHNYVTNDAKVIFEHYPKRPGRILAGGKADPEYGDPGFWYTKPDGSAFSCGAGHAILMTNTIYKTSPTFRWGFDNTVGNLPENPTVGGAGTKIAVYNAAAGGGATVVDKTFTVGQEMTQMIMNRSDSWGQHVFWHESGREWQLWWVEGTPNNGVQSSPYVGYGGYNALHYFKRIALLDLSSVPGYGGDFAERLVDQATPADATDYALTSAAETMNIQIDITRPNPVVGANVIRGFDGATELFQAGSTTGDESIRVYDVLNTTTLLNVAGVLAAGSTVTMNVLLSDDGNLYLFADKVLKGSVAIPSNWTEVTKVTPYHPGAGEDQANLIVNPYPARGLADARVVCPQDDDTFIHSDDFIAITGEIGLPSSGSAQTSYRRADADNRLYDRFSSDGSLAFYEEIGGVDGAEVSGGPGTLSGGEDVMSAVESGNVEMFVDGTSLGSSASITDILTGTSGGTLYWPNNITAAAIELWKYSYLLPFRLPG